MRRTKKEQIEITRPPLEEIKKKNSCLLRGCLTSGGCMLIVLLFFLAGTINLAVRTNTKVIKSVPDHLEAVIPIYDEDSITKITFVSGEDRGVLAERLGYVPKIILAPFVVLFDLESPGEERPPDQTAWGAFSDFMQTPLADHRDIISVKLERLPAEATFIEDFYKKELKKRGITIYHEEGNKAKKTLYFSNAMVEGTVQLFDNPELIGTDDVVFTLYSNPTN